MYLTSDIKGLKGTDCCLSLVKSFNLDVYHLMPEELTEIFFFLMVIFIFKSMFRKFSEVVDTVYVSKRRF